MEEFLNKLVAEGLISKEEMTQVQQEAVESGQTVENILIARGISADEILQAQRGNMDVPVRSIGDDQVPYEILKYIPEESARHYQIIPLGVVEGVLEVGMVNPENIDALDALNFIARQANLPFKVFLVSASDFEKTLKMYRSLGGEVSKALTDLETEFSSEEKKIQAAIDEQEENNDEQGSLIKEDAPVIKIVATILRYAVEGKASDVHIEATDGGVKVRFRVDGILHTSIVLPKNTHRSIVARIKVLSSMRLDERRKPQDGRFSATINKRKVDFRVSTFPASTGEKIVMRILDREKGFIAMEDLGFSDRLLGQVRSALARPYGLILVSGPTGSGKSTTLYSMLSELDRETKNILSLEDPVEYHIDGVNQSQVKPEIGYTFADGLRTTLRQDPDIIMVGEIRDGETAKLAIQAALTGHLVISTIHTNNAIGVIPRLVDMGVDPYLIAPTLVLAIAQRLVQQLCDDGGTETPIDEAARLMITDQFSTLPETFRPEIPSVVYEAKRTSACPNGTRGRIAVFESLPVTEEIKHAVLNNPTEEVIGEIARKQGMLYMKEDAMIKAFERKIPFIEVNKLGGLLLAESGKKTASLK